jgi:hypothetical protein
MFRQLHGGEKLVNIFVLWLANKKETLTKARHMVHYGDPILHTRSRESPASFRCFATFQQHVWIVMQYIAICLISLGTFSFLLTFLKQPSDYSSGGVLNSRESLWCNRSGSINSFLHLFTMGFL